MVVWCLYVYFIYSLNCWWVWRHNRYLFNSQHLWLLFRDNWTNFNNSWLVDQEDIRIRDSYTLKESLYDLSFTKSISNKAHLFYKSFLFDLRYIKFILRDMQRKLRKRSRKETFTLYEKLYFFLIVRPYDNFLRRLWYLVIRNPSRRIPFSRGLRNLITSDKRGMSLIIDFWNLIKGDPREVPFSKALWKLLKGDNRGISVVRGIKRIIFKHLFKSKIYIKKYISRPKRIFAQDSKEWKQKLKKIFLYEKLIISNEFKEIFRNEYNTELTFEYRRFVSDPRFTSYYHLRVLEPTKMSIFLSMGYRHNIYLKYIYQHDTYSDMYSQQLEQDELLGISLLNNFYNYMTRLDNLLFGGNGSIILYHKNLTTTFPVYHKSFGNSYYILPGRGNDFDEVCFFFALVTVVLFKNTYMNGFGLVVSESHVILTVDIVHSLFASQLEFLYDFGMYFHTLIHGWDLMDEWNAGHPDSDGAWWTYQENLVKVHPLHDYFGVLKSDSVHTMLAGYYRYWLPTLNPSGYYKPFAVVICNYIYVLIDYLYIPRCSYKYYLFRNFIMVFTVVIGIITYININKDKDMHMEYNNTDILLSKWLNSGLILSYSKIINFYKHYWDNYFYLYRTKMRRNNRGR